MFFPSFLCCLPFCSSVGLFAKKISLQDSRQADNKKANAKLQRDEDDDDALLANENAF